MQTVEKINLTNLRSCDQIWEEMTVTEKGRVCHKCKNTIIDFRKLSDREVAQTHTFTKGQVCGIYTKRQLQLGKTKPQKRKGIQALYIGILGLISPITTDAQSTTDSLKIVQTEPNYSFIKKEDTINYKRSLAAKDSIILSGTLSDEAGEPVFYGNIHVLGTEIGTTSDFDGKYYLNITALLDSSEQITLAYSFIGFNTEERLIDFSTIEKEENRIIDVVFNQDGVHITNFVVRRLPLHKRIWNGIKRLFTKKN